MEPHEIKAFRKSRSQSQSALGQELGVDRKTIQRWEHGDTRPPGRLLELACKQLSQEDVLEAYQTMRLATDLKRFEKDQHDLEKRPIRQP